MLYGSAFALTAGSIFIFGQVLADFPLALMGTNRGSGFNTQVWGFDTLRGEFSCLSTALIFGPPLLILISSLGPLMQLAMLCILVLLFLWYAYGMHASHPGGPRKHRIIREPMWEDREFHVQRGWRCAVAEESHMLTDAGAEDEIRLTGEPAGRQTWHWSDAIGKEEASFNPSINPNSNDAIWRAQRVSAWESNGRKVPDDTWHPKDAAGYLRKVC